MNTSGVARFPDRQSCRTTASSWLREGQRLKGIPNVHGEGAPLRQSNGVQSREAGQGDLRGRRLPPQEINRTSSSTFLPKERRIEGQHGAWELHGRELFAHNLHLRLGPHSGCRQGLHPADLAHPPEAAAGLAAGGKGGLASPDAANIPRKAARASPWRPGQSSIDPATGIPGWTVSAMSGGARPRRPEIPAERLPTWACRCRTPWGGLWRCRTCPRRWLSRQPCSATVHA